MEDEGFVEDSFIEETAWEYVALHGKSCLAMLERLADSAERAGEGVAAQTWRAIAEAAGHILTSPFGRQGFGS